MTRKNTLFSRFLKELGVPHTISYSDTQVRNMTFNSLYGLSHLLKEYGVENEGWKLQDLEELEKLTPPFLAQKNNGTFVIVKSYQKDGPVVFDERGVVKTVKADVFRDGLNGVVLLAFPDEHSSEPEYKSHALTSLISNASGYLLVLFAVFVAGYFFITRGLWEHVSTVLLTLFNLVGLWLSFMLLQKSLGIHTSTSDAVCGVLERGGCDVITTTKASKLFGVFSWSEVGFGYFGVSLITLLIFPHLWPALALCNILCLPYTLWSITYQKFVAHHWCTLCVGVQLTLWALFFCYLGGGFVSEILPLKGDLAVLIGAYIVAVLSLNRILGFFKTLACNSEK